MKKKRLLPLGILAVLVLAALIYMRPMTLEAARSETSFRGSRRAICRRII